MSTLLFYSRYTFYELGYNLRTTEINGFLGNTQLKYLREIIKRREKNFLQIGKKIYLRTDRYYPIRYSHLDVVSNFAVPVICKTKRIRDELVATCDGIVEIRPIVGGDMTKQPFFRKTWSVLRIYGRNPMQDLYTNRDYISEIIRSSQIKKSTNF